jgi:transcriptional regulator with XRE-family HTH domain
MIDFGSNFRKIREKAGLSQEALGICLALSTSVINRIENNKRRLDVGTVYRLSTVLNLDISKVMKALVDGKAIELTNTSSDLKIRYTKNNGRRKRMSRQLEKKIK